MKFEDDEDDIDFRKIRILKEFYCDECQTIIPLSALEKPFDTLDSAFILCPICGNTLYTKLPDDKPDNIM